MSPLKKSTTEIKYIFFNYFFDFNSALIIRFLIHVFHNFVSLGLSSTVFKTLVILIKLRAMININLRVFWGPLSFRDLCQMKMFQMIATIRY